MSLPIRHVIKSDQWGSLVTGTPIDFVKFPIQLTFSQWRMQSRNRIIILTDLLLSPFADPGDLSRARCLPVAPAKQQLQGI